jgi:hypothetical protein
MKMAPSSPLNSKAVEPYYQFLLQLRVAEHYLHSQFEKDHVFTSNFTQ